MMACVEGRRWRSAGKRSVPLDQGLKFGAQIAMQSTSSPVRASLYRRPQAGNIIAERPRREVAGLRFSPALRCLWPPQQKTLTAAAKRHGDASTAPSSEHSVMSPEQWKGKSRWPRTFFAGRGAVRNAYGPARFRRKSPLRRSIGNYRKRA